jgi:tetratricopeptide (TPR) repeat protein
LLTRTGIWALHVGPPVRRLRLTARPQDRLLAVSPDGRWIALSDAPGQQVSLFDADTGKLLRELPLESCWGPLGFSPDGRWLWALDTRHRCHFWRTATWQHTPPVDPATPPAFAPDSRILAVETGQGRIRLLDPDTRKEFVVLEDPYQDLSYAGMTFSRDGTRLITISHRATQAIHVWDLRRLRAELAEMGLDWQQDPYPPAPPAPKAPARFVVDRGRLPLPPQAGLIAYSLAIVLQPLNPGAYLERASAFARLGRYAEAVRDCDRAQALAPSWASAWFARGQIHEQSRSSRQALADYGQAIRLQPAAVRYRQARLRVAGPLGERLLVGEDSDWLIERKAASPLVLNNRAWDLVTGPPEQRDPPRALRLARQAVELDPHIPTYQNTLGVALYRNGLHREAHAALLRSLEMGKGETAAFDLFFLAMCHARLGERGQAEGCFSRAVKWVKERKGRLPLAWVNELQAFEKEAAEALK